MTTGKVYFIECAGRIKIGYTSNLPERLKSLQTGAPEPLNVLAAIDGSVHFERALHKHAAPYRLNGEWFRDCKELRGMMRAVTDRGGEAIEFIEPKTIRSGRHRSAPVVPSISPLRPVYKRIDACMDRYMGDGIADARLREKALGLPEGRLVNKMIGGYYSLRRSALSFHMLRHTVDSIEGLLDIVRDSIHDGTPVSLEDILPRAVYFVQRLEQGIQRLFENPDADVVDVSGYDGMSLRPEPKQSAIAPSATEFCSL